MTTEQSIEQEIAETEQQRDRYKEGGRLLLINFHRTFCVRMDNDFKARLTNFDPYIQLHLTYLETEVVGKEKEETCISGALLTEQLKLVGAMIADRGSWQLFDDDTMLILQEHQKKVWKVRRGLDELKCTLDYLKSKEGTN